MQYSTDQPEAKQCSTGTDQAEAKQCSSRHLETTKAKKATQLDLCQAKCPPKVQLSKICIAIVL